MTNSKSIGVACLGISKHGGTEIYVRNAIEALSNDGYLVTLITPELSGDALAFAKRFTTRQLVYSELPGFSRHPFRLWRCYRQIHEALKALEDCQLIIFHLYTPAYHWFAKRLRTKHRLVLSMHTSFITCPAGGRYLATSRQPCDRKPGFNCRSIDRVERCISSKHDGQLPFSFLPRLLGFNARAQKYLNFFKSILVNSNSTKALIETHFETPDASVVHPPLGDIETQDPLVAANTLARKTTRLIFVGRLEEYKGCDDAIRCLVRLPYEFELEVFGQGPEQTALESLAEKLGVANRVYFRGWCSQSAVSQALKSAGVMLVPSRLFEAFGQIGPQAIRMGCPVVAYDSGGIRDWCTERAGSLVACGDISGLSHAVKLWRAKLDDGYVIPIEEQMRWTKNRFALDYTNFVRAQFTHTQNQ